MSSAGWWLRLFSGSTRADATQRLARIEQQLAELGRQIAALRSAGPPESDGANIAALQEALLGLEKQVGRSGRLQLHAAVTTGLMPKSTRTVVFDKGTISASHAIGIPFNSSNKAAARTRGSVEVTTVPAPLSRMTRAVSPSSASARIGRLAALYS